MKRTLYALLICVAAVAVVLAVSLAVETTAAPPVIAEFLESLFSEDPQLAFLRFGGNLSQERLMEVHKRYRHMLGDFVEIKSETGSRSVDDDRIEVDVVVAFEKTEAPVRTRLRRVPEGYMIEEIEIDAPPDFEMKPTTKSLTRITAHALESLARRHVGTMYDHLAAVERRRTTLLSWQAQWIERLDSLGVFEAVEPIGTPTEVGKNLYTYAHRLVFEGGVIVVNEVWRWHDIQWICEEFLVEEG